MILGLSYFKKTVEINVKIVYNILEKGGFLMKILRIIGKNLIGFTDGSIDINFTATDRVVNDTALLKINDKVYKQNIVAMIGINASGKTKTLNVIEYILNILLNGYRLNYTKIIPYGIVDGSAFIVYFTAEEQLYKWEFTLKVDEINNVRFWKYDTEVLQARKLSSIKTKKTIYEFPEITLDSNKYLARNQLSNNIKDMMPDDSSITIRFSKKNKARLISVIQSTNVNILLPFGEIPQEILNILDDSIEYIKCEDKDDAINCELKFRNNKNIYRLRNFAEVNNLLSSGTIKGNEVFFAAMLTLINGGYFIIDEIENHFHKELVKLLISLFKSNNTNPNGATIIFSTHYVEILDIVDRKDDIYLTIKDDDNYINIKKYSDYIKRNDLKKSELLLSGIVKGTAPKYESIKKFKDLLWRNLLKN